MPERMSVFDLAELAADVGPNPRTIGVLLELDGPAPELPVIRDAIRARLGHVPRLAQRMRRVPLGAGRPVWEDVDVDLDHHVRGRVATSDLLDVTAAIMAEPLDPERPWWTLTVVELPAEGRSALVWSSHHAMADGPSLLRAVLTLVQDGPERALPPRAPVPGRRALTVEAWADRARSLRALRRAPQWLVGLREVGASTSARVAASRLNTPVTAGFVLRTVDVDLDRLRAGARTCGATVNDALLWSWGGALHRWIADDGRAPRPVVVSCTVAMPSEAIENRIGAVLIPVPPPGEDPAADLAALARQTRRRKRLVSGSTWWLTAQWFRTAGALGLYRRFVDRQRSITTLLTNIRGPVEPLRVLGRGVVRAVPVATLVGNLSAAAAVLSCGGRLVVTVMCSPETSDAADALTADVARGLAVVADLAPQPPTGIVERLRAAGCVFAEDEAELLVAAARTPDELEDLVARRVAGLPLEQILGWAEFCGLRILVEPGVFVPRRRTELLARHGAALVAQGAALAAPRAGQPAPRAGQAAPRDGHAAPRAVVVDLCCGSGAVGVALATAVPAVELHAADIDPAAVACARRNVTVVGGRVHQGDLYEALPAALRGRVDVLVANAPYVPTEEIGLMPPEARLHEARAALDGGADGLDVQRRVAAGAGEWLAPGGHLLIETSEHQCAQTVAILESNGLTAAVVTSEELDATVVVGTMPGERQLPAAGEAVSPR